MKKKFDNNIEYKRIRSVEEIDFDNLSETAKRQLAKVYSTLLGMSLRDANCKDSQG